MKITTKDNLNEVLSALKDKKRLMLEAIGIEAEGFAKDDPNMPVDTGRARNSITSALSGEEAHIKSYTDDSGTFHGEYDGKADGKVGEAVYLGSNVEYFLVIELGSQNRAARHVLQRAVENHTDRYKEVAEMIMKK